MQLPDQWEFTFTYNGAHMSQAGVRAWYLDSIMVNG